MLWRNKVITIKSKLLFIILIVIFGLVSISSFALYTQKASLLTDRKAKTRQLVEAAVSIVAYNYDLQKKGVLTETQAKNQAMSTLGAMRYKDDDYFWINDLDTKMLMHPIKPELNGKDASQIHDSNGTRPFYDATETAKKSGEGFVTYLWPKPGFDNPVPKVSYVKEFQPWGWIIGSGSYLDDINTTFWKSAKEMVLSCVILILLIYLVLRQIIRSISLPLSEIQKAIKDIILTSDLTQRVKISTHDEIGIIADYFNQMLESFQKIIHRVNLGVSEVQSSSAQLNQESSKIFERSRAQSDAAANMSVATEQMLGGIKQVSEHSRRTLEIAQQSGELSDSGEKTVHDAAAEMELIAGAVTTSSASVTQLGEESKQISVIVQTIKDIADQTNLLALNAAIEAARAGEQGRGFAVVADEVRKLAERTSKSTLQISTMIEKIQFETNEAVASMRQGTERVKDGVQKAQQAGLSMARIRGGASQVVTAVNEITASLEQQNSSGNLVVRDVLNITKMAEGNTSAMSTIAQTSEKLALLANSLQESIGQFKT